ncbi:MAG: tetratricopeptide repeat protein [Deltaproteobacteria bacterium]|nr:tetratricopeptide repeat protein [Deltaproteobacteria bacterium]
MADPGIEKLVERATELAQQRCLDDAAALLDEVLTAHPEHLRALDVLGFVRFFQQRYAEGEALCRRALVIKPDHAYAHKGLGLHLAKQGKLDDGVAMLERAIELNPTWLDPYWDLAVTLFEAGQHERALAVLERGASAIPAERPRLTAFQRRIATAVRSAADRGQ